MKKFLVRSPEGVIIGPFTVDEVIALAHSGRISRDCHLQEVGGSSWTSASRVRGIREVFAISTPLPPIPPEPIVLAALKPIETEEVERDQHPPIPEDQPKPTRMGVADRILRGAFGIARGVSVFVILLCVLTIVVGGGVVAVCTVLPDPTLVLTHLMNDPMMADFYANRLALIALAMAAVWMAIPTLIAFVALALLIQIERNTRVRDPRTLEE
ncbi:MAG: hypothetical protein O2800_01160 [Planctomycetota bacterium]|nr:hypothetical protein [Planctomycetota bacterium]